ncbi:hypothetical protein M970_100770 [Encephalitozoon cuniculi EcunIII-L]|uniref:Uncharacterized protein n=1 Tax=Encephalitozoon cuniculi TaxID=6035 RepID=M1KLS6_ENCCN|nr:hypothetical protein ECU10_0850 [Encephalitozoon cuniculi]KMV65237.1 hypothetical protein M970_100770 [Encephalitozoon cuniculi EcunIII-L]UYI26545.1 F-box/leucine-rich repeat domain-containing protein [Encephalitozoon cuniculi]
MKRIGDLKARSKRCLVRREVPGPPLRISWDLAYRMARYEQRLRTLCGCMSPREVSVLVPWKKSYERKGYYEGRAAFDIDLQPFVNLRALRVSDSLSFDLLSINNTSIRKLKLSKVPNVKMGGPVNTVLQEVVLKDSTVVYKDLMNILGIESLIGVSLINVEVSGCHGWRKSLLERLRGMDRLKKVELTNMGTDLQCFIDLSISKGLTWFRIADGDLCLDVKLCLFASVVRCVNALEYLTSLDLGMVEAMYVGGRDLKHMRESLPRLRMLHVNTAEIDSRVFREIYPRYPGLVGLGFVGCTFGGTSFYEIVMHFKSSLKYLNLTSSRLPHDYVSFLKKSLHSCSVRLKSGELVAIGRALTGPAVDEPDHPGPNEVFM